MISVIIPLYNKETSVEQSIRSVLNQSFRDFDLIVVDDGSTDNSLDVVRRIQDDRIVIIEQENGGPSKARNTGVKHAQGEWIVFLDADDELLPEALWHFYTLTQNNGNVDVYCCPYYTREKNIKKLAYSYPSGIITNNFCAHYFHLFLLHTGTSIYSKDILNLCLFDERVRRFEDLDHSFRIFRLSKICVDSFPVLCVNIDFCGASYPRSSIMEDFLGYLDFRNKSFWERMSLYKFYIEERNNYMGQVRNIYPELRLRFDYFLLYKLFVYIKKHNRVLNVFLRLFKLSIFI